MSRDTYFIKNRILKNPLKILIRRNGGNIKGVKARAKTKLINQEALKRPRRAEKLTFFNLSFIFIEIKQIPSVKNFLKKPIIKSLNC